MRNKLMIITSIICCMTSSCSNDFPIADKQEQAPLQLAVQTDNFSRALIENDYFQGVDIAVKLVHSGTTDDYTTTPIFKYTHSREYNYWGYGGWSTTSGSCFVSTNPATVYAYYPYTSSKKDFTAIPIESGQTDYMYGVSLSDVNAKQNFAMLKMQHALAAVRVSAKLGTAKKKSISSVSIESLAFKNKGNMNVFTGSLSDISGDESVKVNYSTALALSSSFQNTDFALIPTGVSAPLTIRFTDNNGIVSEVVTENVTLQTGHIYTVQITANYGGMMTYDKIDVGNWGYESDGDAIMSVGNYKVSCSGDLSGIAIDIIKNDNNVIINAIPTLSYYSVNQVNVTGTATTEQNPSADISGARTITISNIASNVTVNFNGVTETPIEGTIDLTTAPDGVYAVAKNNKGILVEDADESCKAVALVQGTHRFMIEKNEYSNPAWNGETVLFGCYSSFTWPCRQTTIDGINTTAYLPRATNDYYSTPHLSGNYSDWVSGALSDFNGQTNTVTIIANSSNTRDMAMTLSRFNASEKQNQGFSDWYIPACGQMALIYLNRLEINEALNKISGTQFDTAAYFTSTEYSTYNEWYISFSNVSGGTISHDQKNKTGNVRFIRDIIE